jgi:hypothetical protein
MIFATGTATFPSFDFKPGSTTQQLHETFQNTIKNSIIKVISLQKVWHQGVAELERLAYALCDFRKEMGHENGRGACPS